MPSAVAPNPATPPHAAPRGFSRVELAAVLAIVVIWGTLACVMFWRRR